MGAWVLAAESWSVSGFDTSAPYGTETRLAAVVVVRRFTPPPPEPLLRAVASFLRAVVRSRKRPAAREFVPLPEGWDSASGRGGPHEVRFSRERRVVRVGGQEYPLPEAGATLVVLVDERAGTVAPTRFHVLRAPAVRKPSFDATSDKDTNLRHMRGHGNPVTARWREGVMADPVVLAFLEGRD